MPPRVLPALILALAATSVAAALHGRLPGTPGGGDYQAYYDDVLIITWLADANAAQTSGYDADGRMSWTSAQAWIASLNAAQHLGAQDWRLPKITDTGMQGCNFSYNGTDCGYNVNTSVNEMANLYATTLGNLAAYTTGGVVRPCASTAPNYCLSNPGPFAHLQPAEYWSWREYQPDTNQAWYFSFGSGAQLNQLKTSTYYAWAVRDEDIDADQDGIAGPEDNCTLAGNPSQLDTDGDGYGNLCDADINNSGLTTTADYTLLRNCLNLLASTSAQCAAADMNGSGMVTVMDYTLLRNRLNTQPGPSSVCTHGASGSCPWQSNDAFTRTQGAWNGLTSWYGTYNSVYAATSGIVEVGIPGAAGFSLQFSAGDTVNAFFIQSGTLAALNADLFDTTSSSSGQFGGEVLALRLNVDFSAAGQLGTLALGNLHLCAMTDASLNNQTVNGLLALANTLLGGGSNGYTISAINTVVAQLNGAFVDGAPSSYAQQHFVNGACPP